MTKLLNHITENLQDSIDKRDFKLAESYLITEQSILKYKHDNQQNDTLSIYIGHKAIKWSKQCKNSHTLLLGPHKKTINCNNQFMFNEFDAKSDKHHFILVKTPKYKEPTAFTLAIKEKYGETFGKILNQTLGYKKVKLIMANNDVFAKTILTILLQILNNQKIELMYDSINMKSFKKEEDILRTIIAGYPKLKTKKVYLKNSTEHKKMTLSNYFKKLNNKMIKHINKK